jgi:hypothetical protein
MAASAAAPAGSWSESDAQTIGGASPDTAAQTTVASRSSSGGVSDTVMVDRTTASAVGARSTVQRTPSGPATPSASADPKLRPVGMVWVTTRSTTSVDPRLRMVMAESTESPAAVDVRPLSTAMLSCGVSAGAAPAGTPISIVIAARPQTTPAARSVDGAGSMVMSTPRPFGGSTDAGVMAR